VSPPPKSKPDAASALRERALGLLARREHSQAELRRKLADPERDGADLDALLEQLAAAGLQSDARYAEAFVHSRVLRGQGPLRIRQELRQRGVAADLADSALAEAGVDWAEQLAAAYRKRFGSAPPGDRRDLARRARFLAQRGFASEQIRALLTDPGEA
jgi:regulatory protein